MLKIIALSDMHGLLPNITETADIAIIAGDISPLKLQFSMPEMENWLRTIFFDWCLNLKVDKIFLVAGNHDFWFERNHEKASEILEIPSEGKIKYLHNEETKWWDKDGVEYKIFGTPYCHIFGNWAFMYPGDILRAKFEEIPENIDILISHDPAYGFCDIVEGKPRIHCGGVTLHERVIKVKPKLVICGHIHTGNHIIEESRGTKYVNVSLLDEKYQIAFNPFIYEFNLPNL